MKCETNEKIIGKSSPNQTSRINPFAVHTERRNSLKSKIVFFPSEIVQSIERDLVLMQRSDFNLFYLIEKKVNNFRACVCLTQSPNRNDMPFDNYEIYCVPIVCRAFEPTILSSLLHQHEK